MPAPPLLNTLEAGVDGADVAAADPGSPDSFNAITATAPKYTNVQKHSGALSMRWVLGDLQFVQWTGLGTITGNVYVRTYLFLPSLPADNNYYPIQFRTAADASCAILRILSTGIIQGRTADNSNAFAEGTVAVATGQWVRLEWRVLPSTTVGTMEWRLYNTADSLTLSDSASNTGLVLGANIDRVGFGSIISSVAGGITHYFDDLAVATADWIGPSIEAASGRVYKRLYGPAQLGASATTLYTVPDNSRATIRQIFANNPSGSPVDVTLSIGVDGATTRIVDEVSIPAGDALNMRRLANHTLEEGEVLQGFASSAATVVLTVNGVEFGP